MSLHTMDVPNIGTVGVDVYPVGILYRLQLAYMAARFGHYRPGYSFAVLTATMETFHTATGATYGEALATLFENWSPTPDDPAPAARPLPTPSLRMIEGGA